MEARRRRPDFFIVGAPKCGTTALTQYLAEHPEVTMCVKKEVHYFGSDLYLPPGSHPPSTEVQYLNLFPTGVTKRLGEASVWYLYSRRAAPEIKAFSPDADVIIMLRNPPEMLHALHSQSVFAGREKLESFEEALALDLDRAAGRIEQQFVWRTYREAGMYAAQVERYLRAFGQDHVHVILFDDFASDSAAEYRRVCEFLQIDNGFTPSLTVINSNKVVRRRGLQNFMARPPACLRRVVRAVLPRRPRSALTAVIINANQRVEPRTPMSAYLWRQLQSEFADDISRLGSLIQRDMSIWERAGPKTEMTSPAATAR